MHDAGTRMLGALSIAMLGRCLPTPAARAGMADAPAQDRGRLRRRRRHRHRRAPDRAGPVGNLRPAGGDREPAGAGGTTAADAVAKSPKDGYTALMMSNAHAISAVMYKTLQVRSGQRFPDGVDDRHRRPRAGRRRPTFRRRTSTSLIALVKANPGKYNFGSAGVGTTQQFAGELMKQMAGLDVTQCLIAPRRPRSPGCSRRT